MIAADNMNDRDPDRPSSEPRIMDLRHSRDIAAGQDEPEEEAPEAAAEPKAATPTAADADSAAANTTPAAAVPVAAEEEAQPRFEVVGNKAPEAAGDSVVTADAGSADAGQPGEEYYDEELPAELEQLRQIFGIGIGGYLRGQISLMANFALIYLGRTHNPATGLVTREMDKARIAIDMLEFVSSRLAPELNEQELHEVGSLLSELKYMYMQGTAEAAPPISGGPTA